MSIQGFNPKKEVYTPPPPPPPEPETQPGAPLEAKVAQPAKTTDGFQKVSNTDFDYEAGEMELEPLSVSENVPQPGPAPKAADAAVAAGQATQVYNEYQTASKAAEEKDQELSEALGRMGPGLTEEQRQAFITEFQNSKEYKDAYAARDAACAKLAQTLSEREDKLVQAMSDPSVSESERDRLIAAYNVVAKSNAHHQVAKSFSTKVMDPAAAEKISADNLKQVTEDIGGVALETEFNENIKTIPVEEAFAKYKANAEEMFKKYTVMDPNKAKGTLEKLGAARDAMLVPLNRYEKLFTTKDVNTALDGLAELQNNWAGKSKFEKSLAALSLATLPVRLHDAMGKEGTDRYLSIVEETMGAAKDGIEIYLAVSKTAAATLKASGKAGAVTGKLIPALGIIASSAAAVNKAIQGQYLGCAGEVMQAIGTGVAIANPLAGALIVGAGVVTVAVADLIEDEKQKSNRASHVQMLQNLTGKDGKKLLDPHYASVLALDDGKSLKELSERHHLTAEQIQELSALGFTHQLIDDKGGPATLHLLDNLTTKVQGYYPSSNYQMLRDVATQFPSPQYSNEDRSMALMSRQHIMAAIAEKNSPMAGPQSAEWWNNEIKKLLDPHDTTYQAEYKAPFKDNPVATRGATSLGAYLVAREAPRPYDT